MGAWGTAIRSDDFVSDVVAEFRASLKELQDLPAARAQTIEKFAGCLEDDDDAPLFWIALADIEWEYGVNDAEALRFIKADYVEGRGLEGWEDDPKQLKKRREVIEAFIQKLQNVNPKPARIPKITLRPPALQAGDCISVLLEGGYFGAAIVLAADATNPEYGTNLIGVLDYYSLNKPERSTFEMKNWLVLSHHNWKGVQDYCWYPAQGFKSVQKRIEVVCRIPVSDTDRPACNSSGHWENVCHQVIFQRLWDKRDPDT